MAETETGHYRWNDKEFNECYTRIVPVVNRLQILLQQFQAVSQYEESLKQYGESLEQGEKVEENNKGLRHLLESCHRVRTQTEDVDPPIPLGNGRYLVTIAEDPTAW